MVIGHCNAGTRTISRVGVISHRGAEAQRRFIAGAPPQTPKTINSHAIDRHSGYGAEPHLSITPKLCVSVPLCELSHHPLSAICVWSKIFTAFYTFYMFYTAKMLPAFLSRITDYGTIET